MERICELLGKGIKPADASAEAGFASSSAFHSQFAARTRGRAPVSYAALGNDFVLRLPSAYRFREVLDFYGRDPQSVSESVNSTCLRKCVMIEGEARLIEIAFRGTSARCTVEGPPREAHRLIIRMLGLDSDADPFERQFAADSLLGSLLRKQRGLRIPLTPEPWEALAWAILGQQISLKARSHAAAWIARIAWPNTSDRIACAPARGGCGRSGYRHASPPEVLRFQSGVSNRGGARGEIGRSPSRLDAANVRGSCFPPHG